MSTANDRDKLDAILEDWPLPKSDDASWDDRADAITRAAMSATAPSAIDLLAAPSLAAEPGEPAGSTSDTSPMSQSSRTALPLSTRGLSPSAGDAKMSDENAPQSKRPRPSLKEMAERVSKTPPPPSSSMSQGPMSARPSIPGNIAIHEAAPLSQAPVSQAPISQAPVSQAPVSQAPLSQAPASQAPLSQAPVSQAVSPASEPPRNTLPSAAIPIGSAKKSEEKKKGGLGIGLGVAAVGLAAAAGIFFFLQKKPVETPKVSEPTTEAAVDEKPAATTETKPTEEPAPKQDDGAIDINQLGNATADPTATPGGPLPPTTAGGPIAAKEPEKPVKIDPDGTLDDAMKKAAGPLDQKDEVATPAQGTPKNLPDQPPQGSVTSAIGSVMGGARACVAGADDVSRATITFNSSGAVQSVSVGGWASGKPAASCIQSALKGANVGPFSKPTFTTGANIRP